MIGISDNCATYDNIVLTTLKHVNQVMQSLGMKNSALHHWCMSTCPGYISPCPNDDGSAADNALTARDVITALTSLYTNNALSPAYTKQAYQYLLTAHGWTPMLSMYPPVPVAHKQGWLPADLGFNPLTENDEAIVFACSPFGTVVLIQQNWTNTDDDQTALALGAQIGRLAYCTIDTEGVATDGQPCSATWATQPGPGCAIKTF
jgi:beta-lactamase class A